MGPEDYHFNIMCAELCLFGFVRFRSALPIGVNLAVLRSVAQTFSLRLIGHKLKVCATTHLRSCQARFQQYRAVRNHSYRVSGRRPVFLN